MHGVIFLAPKADFHKDFKFSNFGGVFLYAGTLSK